ncbi:P-loop containing nucleoside triphosphate hydrolase protein [Baffinella frigidus]|nr:P-loop containing nucleoside triphosphate hydrolase protein [Cryptophyta sp. CCMP2293]
MRPQKRARRERRNRGYGNGGARQEFNEMDRRPEQIPDWELDERQLSTRYRGMNQRVLRSISMLDPEAVNYQLVADLILCGSLWSILEGNGETSDPGYQPDSSWRDRREGREPGGGGENESGAPGGGKLAVLIFFSGVKEIETMYDLLMSQREINHSASAREWILPLHGSLPPEEQRRVFQRPPPGVRKIVLATNVAETSITIDDVGYVIDTARMKERRYDPVRRLASLEDCMISRANARQRRGRAGRVAPGVAVHLFSSHTHDAPEIKRVPLEQLVLRIRAMDLPGTSESVCRRIIEPPESEAVRKAVAELVDIEALSVRPGKEELTALGRHLATLPVDARLGKLILLGAAFGPEACDMALTAAAALASRSPFLSPPDAREAADRARSHFAEGGKWGPSDHLAILVAYYSFNARAGGSKMDFAREMFLGIKTLQGMGELKRQLLQMLSESGFVRSGLRSSYVEQLGRRGGDNDGVRLALLPDADPNGFDPRDQEPLLGALLCASLFPQIIMIKTEVIDDNGGKTKKGKESKAPPAFFIHQHGTDEPVKVSIHPSSVNHRTTKFAEPYLVYHQLVFTTKTYVRDCTPVSPLALVLFGGALTCSEPGRGGRMNDDVLLTVDGWISFSVPSALQRLLMLVREELDELLKRKISDPSTEFSEGNEALLNAVLQLLASQDRTDDVQAMQKHQAANDALRNAQMMQAGW